MRFERFDYRKQDFRFSRESFLQLIGSKHACWAHRTKDATYYQCAGDLGGAWNSSMGKLAFDKHPRGYEFAEVLSETELPPAGYTRPASPDDGGFYYAGENNPNPELRDAFVWLRGNDGQGLLSNVFTRALYGATDDTESHNPLAAAKMREDGWTQGKLNIFYPAARGFKEWDFSGWPCEKHGQNIPHPATKGNAACRNAAFDIATNTLFCFYDYDNNLNLVAFRLDSKTIEIWTVGSWWHPDGRRFFLEAMRPPSPEAVTEDGFAYLFPDNGRWYSACNLMWEHSATWVNPADGKLYAISPQTGYQWCFETRAGVKTGPDGQDRIPFYPVGKRIELNGCWPSLASHFNYPPTTGGADVRMNSFMAPFKGGILWWTSGPYGHGVTGIANMMAWRRLGNEGPWTTVTCPNEFSANALAPKSLSAGNDEVLAISQASTTIDLNYTPWFWRITP